MSLLQNKDFGVCYPSISDDKLTAVNSVADSESTMKEEEAVAKETEHSTSRPSLKRDRCEEDEVTSKHTSPSESRPEDIDPKVVHDVVPVSSRPPLPKKPRADTWDLDNMLGDDDDSD